MSDINTIVSNYKNNLDKKMTDSHTALKEELQASGGSEWKEYHNAQISNLSSLNLPENYEELLIIAQVNKTYENLFMYTSIIKKSDLLDSIYRRVNIYSTSNDTFSFFINKTEMSNIAINYGGTNPSDIWLSIYYR